MPCNTYIFRESSYKMSLGFTTEQQVQKDMRVLCPHCQKKAIIKASNKQSSAVTDLYCRCDNLDCQSGFVMTLSHKHDIQPPIKNMQSMLTEMLRNLPPEQRQEVISQASP